MTARPLCSMPQQQCAYPLQRAKRHGPAPDHPSQRHILQRRSEENKTVKDLMRRAEIVKRAGGQSFRKPRGAECQLGVMAKCGHLL